MHSAKQRRALLELLGHSWPRSAPPAQVRRVLLIRPDHIGDVLLTSPAVGMLRESLSSAQLTYLVGPWAVEAARHGPAVDQVRALAFPGFTRRKKPNALQPYAVLLNEVARLRRAHYDLAVILRPDHWWGALLALVAGIPLRVGSETPLTTPLLTHARASAMQEHAVQQALGLAELAVQATGGTCTRPEQPRVIFNVSEAARTEATTFWQQHGLDQRQVVVVQPSAGAVLKSWPVERWARLIDGLTHPVVLSGGPADGALLQKIARATRTKPIQAFGQTLELSAAIYARAALVIAPDSAAGHLAQAVGTPTLRLYGPAPPAVFGPWPATAEQQVIQTTELRCVPCGHLENPPCGARKEPACMLALQVEFVLEQAKRILSSSQN